MSRSIDKHPGKVCPRGRARCWACSGSRSTRRRALAAAVFPNELDVDVEDHDFTDEDVAARGPDVVQAWPNDSQPLGNDAECNGSGRVAAAGQAGGA